jgi:hypothetical protein
MLDVHVSLKMTWHGRIIAKCAGIILDLVML